MKFEIHPTADRLLVKPLTADEISKGGVIIPDMAQEKPQQGLVAAAGPDVAAARRPFDRVLPARRIVEGDRVLYGKYSGTEVTIDGESYLILREADILALLRPIAEEQTCSCGATSNDHAPWCPRHPQRQPTAGMPSAG